MVFFRILRGQGVLDPQRAAPSFVDICPSRILVNPSVCWWNLYFWCSQGTEWTQWIWPMAGICWDMLLEHKYSWKKTWYWYQQHIPVYNLWYNQLWYHQLHIIPGVWKWHMRPRKTTSGWCLPCGWWPLIFTQNYWWSPHVGGYIHMYIYILYFDMVWYVLLVILFHKGVVTVQEEVLSKWCETCQVPASRGRTRLHSRNTVALNVVSPLTFQLSFVFNLQPQNPVFLPLDVVELPSGKLTYVTYLWKITIFNG